MCRYNNGPSKRSGRAQRERALRAEVAPKSSPSALVRASHAPQPPPMSYSSATLCSLAPISTIWPYGWSCDSSQFANPISTHTPRSTSSKSSKTDSLSGIMFNARSLPAHRDSIFVLLQEESPDFVCVTETWLSPSSAPDIIQCLPLGYSILHKDRPSRSPGGGVAFILKDELKGTVLPLSDFSFMESILIRLNISPSSNLVFLLVYRPPPPDSSFALSFAAAVADLLLQYPQLILLGDFNVGAYDPSDQYASNLLACLSDLGFSQLINFPTHCKGRTLDLIFTTSPIIQPATSVPVLWTDHLLVPFTISIPPRPVLKKPLPVPRRKWSSVNTPEVVSSLLTSTHDSTEAGTLSIQQLHTCLTQAADIFAPLHLTTPRSRPSAPWYTPALRALRLSCRQAERAWRQSYATDARVTFRQHCRTYHQAISLAKTNYYSNRIIRSSNSSRELFTISRELSSLPPPRFPLVSQDVCNDLAVFFTDKIKQIREKICPPAPCSGPLTSPLALTVPEPPDKVPTLLAVEPSLAAPPSTWSSFPSFSNDTILKAILSLKSASPSDPIPLATMKNLAPSLIEPFTMAVNNCFLSGHIPPFLKHALVIPLLKKSTLDPAVFSNYRPISLLSFLMKLLESLATPLLRDFLESQHILDPFQSGFRPQMGTETVLVTVLDDLSRIRDQGGVGALILLDLSAAFDTIDHTILLARIREAGVTGAVLEWFRSFLSDRSFSLSLPPFQSSSFPLLCGVPQGSALSPLLFNLYIRPLAELIHSHGFRFFSYADDTQLLLRLDLTTASTATRLRSCLAAIGEWMNSNWLKLNGDKTELLVVGPPDTDTLWDSSFWPQSFGPLPKPLPLVKNLGFRIRADLSREAQVSHICSTGYGKLKILRKILPLLPPHLRQAVVTSTMMGSIDYCNALFLAQPAYLIQRLQILQNSAARLVLGLSRREHISSGLRSLHWLPVASRIQFKALCIVHRAFYDQGPSYLKGKFVKYRPSRSLRSDNQLLLVVPRFRLQRTGGRSFSVAAAKLWNALPLALRATQSSTSFRRLLKTYLF